MRMDFPVIKPVTLAIASLFMCSALHAADEPPAAGVVVMVVGQVTATGRAGGGHPLQRRSNIFSGETIVTGKDSRVQIRFSDGSLISLQEGSQFRIENFSYKQENKGDNATYQLLKGGMRTISGAVGKVNRDEYKVETPVATIGIRGTDYELMLHDSDNTGSDELYGYINDGVINAANKAGKKDFADNEFFKIVGPDMPPQPLLNPPGFMFEGYVPESTAKDGGGLRPLDPTLVPLLTSIETSDLLNATINPMITPYATVTQLTGFFAYGIAPNSGNATDLSGIIADTVSGATSVDFDKQLITTVSLSAGFADGRSFSLSNQASAPISSIAQGGSIALTGGCSGGTCGVVAPTPVTGSTSLQFIGHNADGIIETFNAQDTKSVQGIKGTALLTILR